MSTRTRWTAGLLLAGVLTLAGCVEEPAEPSWIGELTREPATTAEPTTATRHPIEAVTPGDVFPGATAGQVCTPGWATAHRDRLSVRQERVVLARYGLPTEWATESGHISEWDHLVPLELGGANGTGNIWPMTNHDQDQRKDRLENRLHREVCDGEMGLAEAQAQARRFWRFW